MNSVDESLRFFSRVSAAFHTSAGSLWCKYPDCDRDPWDALGVFLEGYAFEHQGRNPDHAHVAADVVKEMKETGVGVTDPDCPTLVWKEFLQMLKNNRLNENEEEKVKSNAKVNPLCPEFVKRPSAIEVAARLARDPQPTTITAFAKQCLKGSRVDEAYKKLDEINGIGPKIACLFLRDIASEFVPQSAVALELQPVDIHVRRISRKLMACNNATGKEVADWIVQQSEKARLNPLNVNSGMWHFGSLVAGSGYRALKALDDLSSAEKLVDSYMERQSQVVGNWQAKG